MWGSRYKGTNTSQFSNNNIERGISSVYAPTFDEPVIVYKPKTNKLPTGPISWESMKKYSKEPNEEVKEISKPIEQSKEAINSNNCQYLTVNNS